jgi:hypothetical protein
LTGTYGVGLTNSAANRAYVATYTVSSANTWEYKTITIPGDTSGTWLTDNTTGIRLRWDIGSGSNYQGTAGSWGSSFINTTSAQANLIGTSGSTFYLTGVQLEKGSAATSFDFRDYGRELAMCQRYYISTASPALVFNSTYNSAQFPVTMRATPTVTITVGSGTISSISASTSGFLATNTTLSGASYTAAIEL